MEDTIYLESTKYVKSLDKWDPKKTFKEQLREWGNFCCLINGMSRSGKSYLLKKILKPILHKFAFICIFSKTIQNGFYQDFIVSDLMFDDFKPEVVDTLKNEYYKKEKEEKKFKILFIIDDCISNNLKYQDQIGSLFMSGRHWNASTVILGQKCSMFNQTWIANVTIFISLYCGSKREKKYISENIISNFIEVDPKDIPKGRNLKFAEEEKEAFDMQTEICQNYFAIVILPLNKNKKLFWYRA